MQLNEKQPEKQKTRSVKPPKHPESRYETRGRQRGSKDDVSLFQYPPWAPTLAPELGESRSSMSASQADRRRGSREGTRSR